MTTGVLKTAHQQTYMTLIISSGSGCMATVTPISKNQENLQWGKFNVPVTCDTWTWKGLYWVGICTVPLNAAQYTWIDAINNIRKIASWRTAKIEHNSDRPSLGLKCNKIVTWHFILSSFLMINWLCNQKKGEHFQGMICLLGHSCQQEQKTTSIYIQIIWVAQWAEHSSVTWNTGVQSLLGGGIFWGAYFFLIAKQPHLAWTLHIK